MGTAAVSLRHVVHDGCATDDVSGPANYRPGVESAAAEQACPGNRSGSNGSARTVRQAGMCAVAYLNVVLLRRVAYSLSACIQFQIHLECFSFR